MAEPAFPTGMPGSALPTGMPGSGFPTGMPGAGFPTDMPRPALPTGLPAEVLVKMWNVNPLPKAHRDGLIAITVPALLSLLACFGLAVHLGRLIVRRRRKRRSQNQLAILVFNLMLADIQQSLGFLLEAHWLRINKIEGTDDVCWAQGFLVSAGSVACVLFSFAIGLYTFVFITFRFQLRSIHFYSLITLFWLFVYLPPLGPVFAGVKHFFVPQGIMVG